MTESTKSIFILEQQQAAVRTIRLIRQYYKDNSCSMWPFHSESTHEKGVFPVNAMNVVAHPAVDFIELSLQSFIIESMGRKYVNQGSLQMLLDRVTSTTSFMQKKLKLARFNGNSFAALFEAVQQEGKWKEMLEFVKMLQAGEISFERSKQATIANKKTVLTVGNRGSLKTLSGLNDKNVAIAEDRMLM